MFLGLVAVIGGNFLEGGQLDSLLNGPAFLIVCGGTLGATLLQTPVGTFWRAFALLKWVIKPPAREYKRHIDKIVKWSALARKEGLLGLEAMIAAEKDLFARKGLQLLVDGNEADVIRDSLEVELVAREKRDLHAARVFESMGGFAPTLGILGAVMGLIHVMQNLADPGKLGGGIATAFVATVYGVAFSNLLVIPIANKLRAHVVADSQQRELILEGVIAIAEGENPRNIELKLSGFLQG